MRLDCRFGAGPPRASWKVGYTLLLGATLLLVAVSSVPAQASDNHCFTTAGTPPVVYCDVHWHSSSVMLFQTMSNVPWPSSVAAAATSWRNATKFDPTPWAGTSINRVEMKAFPTAWQSWCPTSSTLACNRVTFWDAGPNPYAGHPAARLGNATESDLIYNSAFSADFTTNCLDATKYDVQTIGLHEFGHAGHLEHSAVPADTMWPAYAACIRDLSLHAISSMNYLYTDAGH